MSADLAGAIDIGSNAVRMSIARRGKDGAFKTLASARAPIRLGHDVFRTGRISPASGRRLERALRGFATQMRRQGVSHARAVATSALREAGNRAALLKRLSEACRFPVEPISGLEEAALIRRAVQLKMDLAKGPGSLLVELGGGSAEVSLVEDGLLRFSECWKVGAVRLLELHDRPRGRRFESLIQQYCGQVLRRLKQHLPRARAGRLVGTGGNIEELARLAGGRRKRGVLCVRFSDLEWVSERLARWDVEQRVARFGLRPDRADVILPACLFVLQLMETLGFDEILVPFANLREGILSKLFSAHLPGEPTPESRREILEAAGRYLARYQVEQKHAVQVRCIALDLFDQLSRLHGLNGGHKLLLELAALFHDSGYYISTSAHHKHSQYLLSQMKFPGLDPRQVEMAALVARYHRKALPKLSHPVYSALAERERSVVRKLGAILRLADSLDRGQRSLVKGLRLRVERDQVEISCLAKGDLWLQRAEVRGKWDFFALSFGRKVRVRQVKDGFSREETFH
jgi:exopolyphosphatase/guanosine-5'-triphosphate,3'-diphosphate pyrophosphatase